MDTIIGIDLGTTNSAAAYLADDGPRLIPNGLGEVLTPSVVGLDDDGKVLVGRTAKELQVLRPERCAALFKRLMGTDTSTRLGGRSFTPEELSSLVLRTLRADAEAHFGKPVERAVVTVPAYFNDQQRKATLHAGQIAGLRVERIFNEPTAAALAYGFHESKEEKKLLILDLGGGTFDVSVVELFEGTLEVKASAGEGVLGGEDFTRALAARVLETRKLAFERAEMTAPRLVSRLIQQCEVAKRRLSRQDAVAVRVPDAEGNFPQGAPEVEVTRAQFETWTSHILTRIELPIRRVLGDAGLRREDVDEVLLVGGATRMPMLVERVRQLLGKEPQGRLNPDEVVALGAAVQAGFFARSASVEDMVVTDVSPFTLGVEIVKQLGNEIRDGYFQPVIQRNSTIPISRVERVGTVYANQSSIRVKIYQGESRRTSENLLLGEFEVSGIQRGPAGQDIDIRFTYDLHGILEVEVTVVATGKKVSHVVSRYARGMTPAQVTQAVREMEKLKTHPREEAVNRHLLRRAERIYQELPRELREVLGLLLDAFESALALQEPDQIAQQRQQLEMFLSANDLGLDDSDAGA